MKVFIVIVNYGTPRLTIQCLESLAPEIERVGGTRVIVVDNASPDDSLVQILDAVKRNGWTQWCHVLPSPKNGGFAYGNNQALRTLWASECSGATCEFSTPKQAASSNEYVWLLNPDTRVIEGALSHLLEFLSANPSAALVGSRIENEDGSVRKTAFRFHSPLGELESVLQFGMASRLLSRFTVAPHPPDGPTRVDWVSGASLVVRMDVFRTIGLLDENFFLYYEETDFCLRAARAGYECWYVPSCRVVHYVGQSSGVTGTRRRFNRRPKYWFDSRRLYFLKHHGVWILHLSNVLWITGYILGWIWARMRSRTSEDPPLLLWDFVRFNYFPSRWQPGYP